MKYKLSWDEVNRCVIMDATIAYAIYREKNDPSCGGINTITFPNGFWEFAGLYYKAPDELKDYFHHRDEYIAEAKKILVKERL